jgi:hypothetical protein
VPSPPRSGAARTKLVALTTGVVLLCVAILVPAAGGRVDAGAGGRVDAGAGGRVDAAVVASPGASSPTAPRPLITLTRYLVDNLAARTYRGDAEFFDGQWLSADPSCWMCSTGPGAAAAVLSSFPGPRTPYYRRLAERTFTDAIRRYRRPDGSFADPAAPAVGDEIPTIFFGVELGQAYMQLRGSLPRGVRRLWRHALARAARYLVGPERALRYYVNGNINLQITELLYFAWQATGSPVLRRNYKASWRFTLHPGPAHPGFGLQITRAYHARDGRDGAGYLAESGGGAPGFDADYAQLQADEVARLYVYSHDRRALVLTNLLANELLTRRVSGWWLDTSGGTRHPDPGRRVPLTTSAFAVLGWLDGRPVLRRGLAGQLRELRLWMCGALSSSQVNLYRAMGNEVSVVLRAAELSRVTRMKGLGSHPICPNLPPALRRKLIS